MTDASMLSLLQKKGYAWYYIEAGMAFLRSGLKPFDRTGILEEKDETRKLDLTALRVETFTCDFTPTGWVEPIYRPVGRFVPEEFAKDVAREALTRLSGDTP